MPEGLIEVVYDPAPHVPQSFDDYSSEEDSRPLRIKRRAVSSSKKLHGKAPKSEPLRKLRLRGVSSFEKSHGKVLSLKRRHRGAFSSKNSLGKDLPLKMQCRGNALSEESHGKGKVSEDQDDQPLLKMQHDGAFSPENSHGIGAFITGLEEEPSFIVGDENYDNDIPPEDDDQLMSDFIGCSYPPCGSNQPELYWILVSAKSGEERDFVDLLTRIGCGGCFVVRSVESPRVFYAKLDANEVAKLKGLEEIANVTAFRDLVGRC